MLFSIPLALFNIHTAFSGVTYVEDYYFALYRIIMTNYAGSIYCLTETVLDQKYKGFDDVSGYLSSYYRHAREVIIQPIVSRLFKWSLYSWVSGFILFHVSFFTYGPFNGIISYQGKTDGVWTAGFTCLSVSVVVYHLIIYISTRNYTIITVPIYIFSFLCFMPITVLMNENTPGTMTYKQTFSDILS